MEAAKMFRRFAHRTDFYLFLVLIIGCIAIQIISGGQLFEVNTIVDIARSVIIFGMFALVNVMVVISGGFDLSFPTLASLSYSATATIVLYMGWCKETAWAAFLIAGIIGLLGGLLNGFLIGYFKLDAMIVTLGTQTLFLGLSMGLFQFREITSTLPQGLNNVGDSSLFVVYSSTGMRSIMPSVFLMFIFLALLVWFILNRTMFGRSIFAIGGSAASAERAGINVLRTKILLYAFVGFVAGIIGITRVCMVHQSIPKALTGWDLRVIPAVILGGASIYGGEGSVFGTLIAVILITVISNSLLLIGVDSYWQTFFNGIVILVGVTVSAVQAKRRSI